MSERRTLIVTGLVVMLIIILILGVVWYLVNFIRNRQTETPATSDIFPRSSASISFSPAPTGSPLASGQNLFPQTSGVPTPTAVPTSVPVRTPASTPAPTPSVSPANPNVKVYGGQGYTVSYPKNWGILTCNNSKNIEFDPYNSSDQLNYTCNFAVKPITVIVGQASCTGTLATFGSNRVLKSTRQGTKGTIYRWCTQSNPMLDITHRLAQTTQTGYSKDDFSSSVEQMISTITFSANP